MTTTPSKAEQVAEAAARTASGNAIPPNETATALDVGGDGAPQDPLDGRAAPAPQPQGDQPQTRQPPKTGGIFDDKRAAIVARFRAERNAPVGETDEITDFTRSGGMPEDFRQFDQATGADVQPQPDAPAAEEGAQPAPDAAAAPPAAEPPKTVKLTVHGKEKELTFDEVIAQAQIALASDNILDAAKTKLKDIEALEADVRNRVQRGDSPGQHQAGPAAHPAGQPDPSADPSNTTEDPFQKMVEAIQFGDPAEARTIVQNTIGQVAQAATQQALANNRLQQDAIAGQKAKADFEAKHPDIAADPNAVAVMERNIFDQQAADLKALNVDLNRIRNDGLPATPADIANYHQALRADGRFAVRSIEQMFDNAHKNFLEWKGIKPNPAADLPAPPTPPQPPQQQRSPAPKVEITVDRQQRRQAAPPQPARPAPAPAPQPQAPRERSDVIQAMKDRNARLRGSTLGIR